MNAMAQRSISPSARRNWHLAWALTRSPHNAHSRRKFHRALQDGDRGAVWFIGQFRQLSRLEREAKNLLPEDRHQIRQEQAAPIWATIQERAQALQPQLLPKSSLGKALSYFLNEYEALTGYLKSGTLQIDNNWCYAARGINQVMPTAGLCRVADSIQVFSA